MKKKLFVLFLALTLSAGIFAIPAYGAWDDLKSVDNNDYSLTKTATTELSEIYDMFYSDIGTPGCHTTKYNGFFVDKKNRLTLTRIYTTTAKKTGVELIFLDDKKNIAETKKIVLPGEKFGNVLNAGDGNYYIVSGNTNTEEKNIDTFIITKYNKEWKETEKVAVKGSSAQTTVPFDAGTAKLEYYDNKLVFYGARQRYTSEDGKNHQSNYTAVIDTAAMKTLYESPIFPLNHVSHSFNQFVKIDNGKIYFLDHGDAYPRSVVLQSLNFNAFIEEPSLWRDERPGDDYYGRYWANTENKVITDYDYIRTRPIKTDLFEINGNTGDNQTGVWTSEMGMLKTKGFVAGNATPHQIKVAGLTGDMNSNRNAYFILFDKEDTSKFKFSWLSRYDPNGDICVKNVQAAAISDTEFVVMYDVYRKYDYSDDYLKTYCAKINEDGKVLKKFVIDARLSVTAPVYKDGKIIWGYVQKPVSADGPVIGFAELKVK